MNEKIKFKRALNEGALWSKPVIEEIQIQGEEM